MSCIGMVLWSNWGKDCEVALRKCGHEKNGRSAGLSEESAGEASNLMQRPVQRGNRNAITSACVGWDLSNIENRSAFRKQAELEVWTAASVKMALPPPGLRSRSSK